MTINITQPWRPPTPETATEAMASAAGDLGILRHQRLDMIVFEESSKLTFSRCTHVPVVSISLYIYIIYHLCVHMQCTYIDLCICELCSFFAPVS